MTEPEHSFHIDVDYEDESLRERIEDGSTGAMGWIRFIRAGEETLIGDGQSDGMREYLFSFFGGVVQSLTETFRGERAHFTAANGPIYVVLEPVNPDAVRFTLAYTRESIENPDARRSFEPSAIIDAESMVEGVVQDATGFLTQVEEWNPELASSSADFRGLKEDIAALKQAYADFEERGGF